MATSAPGQSANTVARTSGRVASPFSAAPGGPLELDIDLVDEDPNQPRKHDNPGFAPASLAELAATVRLRGVKTPISVRMNPDDPGRYIINHGARRFRASRLAGKDTIPAFIDNDYNYADQVIENLHRNELTAREIADYVGRELAKGLRKREIGEAIGKSASFVTQHVTLLDLPDPVAVAFKAGRARDVTVVNELVKLFKMHPTDVTAWLSDATQDISRSTVKLLRDFLRIKFGKPAGDDEAAQVAGHGAVELGDLAGSKANGAGRSADRLRSPLLQVQYEERVVLLDLHRRPTAPGLGWLQYDDGAVVEVELAQVLLVALLERPTGTGP